MPGADGSDTIRGAMRIRLLPKLLIDKIAAGEGIALRAEWSDKAHAHTSATQYERRPRWRRTRLVMVWST